MRWDNRGSGEKFWHMDHILPLCLISQDPENTDLIECLCHYSNLRPFWQPDNIRKAQYDVKMNLTDGDVIEGLSKIRALIDS